MSDDIDVNIGPEQPISVKVESEKEITSTLIAENVDIVITPEREIIATVQSGEQIQVEFSNPIQGSAETSGVSGSSGTSGTAGSHGSSGTSGTSGVAGTSGTSGLVGTSGTSGTSGSAGSHGTSGTSATGTSGTSGTSGLTGSSGVSGSAGTSGTSGSSGTHGTSGTSGSTGTHGTSGTAGSSGSSGTSGVSGTSGSSGPAGTSGTSGASGTSGTSGTSGSSHNPVTVSSPIFLSGQALSLVNNAVSPGTITTIDIDKTFAANSDLYIPTQKAVKGGISDHAALITGVHGLVFTAGKTLTLTESLTLNALPIGGIAVATAANTLGSLAVGVAGQYLAGGGAGTVPAWATLNQAAVAGLTTADGPSFAHLHLANLAAITTAAESWVGPSSTAGVYFKAGNVGIGTTEPGYPLTVRDATIATGVEGISVYGYDGAAVFSTTRAESPFNAALSLCNNPINVAGIGTGIFFRAKSDTVNNRMQGEIYTTWTTATDATRTSRMTFRTQNSGASSGDAVIILGNGNVGIGTATIPSMLTVAGLINMKNYTVGTLPAGTRGDVCYVTDALAPTFLAAVVAGGAVVTPCFYDGVSWKGF